MLTRAILSEGCKSVAAGMNPMDLRRGINKAVDHVVGVLKSRAKMISTTEEIAQVGTISANGEREIGELIARAMEKVGKEGVITVAVSFHRLTCSAPVCRACCLTGQAHCLTCSMLHECVDAPVRHAARGCM